MDAFKTVSASISDLFPVIKREMRTCERHGEYEARLFKTKKAEHWSTCPACFDDEVKAEDRQIARAAQVDRIDNMLGRAAIPKRFLDRTFETYEAKTEAQAKAFRSCKRYAESWKDNQGASLIMCGRPGTGKTHLAVSIARHVMNEGGAVLFARMIDLARSVKETYRKDSEKTERQVIKQYADVDLLILDEIGHQHGSDNERMVLFDVINARYEECKPTILITNLDLNEMRGFLDDRAVDRLREGGGRSIVFDWESYRSNL